jgi:hypothetical protein
MAESNEFTSNLENRLVEKNLEKDKSQAVRNVIQQSIYEERMANNGLKISVLFHMIVIISLQSIIWFKINLIELNINDYKSFKLNLINFNYIEGTNSNTIDYNCVIQENHNFSIKKDCDINNSLNSLLDNSRCQELNNIFYFSVEVPIY